MAKNRIKASWLLLPVLLCAAAVLLSVGVSQARYDHTATAYATVKASTGGVSSDCLITRQDPPCTVLLGRLEGEETCTVPFWLLSSGSNAAGALSFSVSDPYYGDYLDISVLMGEDALEAGAELALQQDVKTQLNLCITLTEVARNTSHEEWTVQVQVTWGEDMQGTFQVTVPEAELVSETTPETEPAEQTEPTEETSLTESETEPSALATGESEEADPVQMKALPVFRPEEQLPVMLTLTQKVTAVRFGLQTTVEQNTLFSPLPDYTMISLDQGATYYMVYGDHFPEFSLQNPQTLPVLLDFTYAQLNAGETLTLAMETCVNGQWNDRYTADSAFHGETSDSEKLIVTFANNLEFHFPVQWETAELEYTVDFLTMTEEKTLVYQPATLSEDQLYATYTREENNHKLQLQLGSRFMQPGTYRICMTWAFEGVCYAQTETTFFVNCEARTEEMPSG